MRRLPRHESEQLPNVVYDLLAGGGRLGHLEARRDDAAGLGAPGARRIRDPTAAGDFCRRFSEGDVERLMDTVNEAVPRGWAEQPGGSFDEAFLDADGRIAHGGGWCKKGWTSPPTGRAATAPWPSDPPTPPSRCSWSTPDKAVGLWRRGGRLGGTTRGDTDSTRTRHLGRGDTGGVRFSASPPWPSSRAWPSDRPACSTGDLSDRPDARSRPCPDGPDGGTGSTSSPNGFATPKLIGGEVAEFECRPAP
jgi:hypothetical protein